MNRRRSEIIAEKEKVIKMIYSEITLNIKVQSICMEI